MSNAQNFPSIKDILICEDHPLIQAGIKISVESIFPDLKTLRIGSTGKRCLELMKEQTPDLALVDLGLPDMTGINLIQSLRLIDSSVKIIVITSCDTPSILDQVRKLKVQGIIQKSSSTEHLASAITSMRGYPDNIFLDPAVKAILETQSEVSFTMREHEILSELVKGQSNQQIADKFSLSLATVRTHRANILQKTNIRTGAELIAWYLSGQGKRY